MHLRLIHPADLNPVQRELYDDMRAGIVSSFSAFRTVRDDGTSQPHAVADVIETAAHEAR